MNIVDLIFGPLKGWLAKQASVEVNEEKAKKLAAEAILELWGTEEKIQVWKKRVDDVIEGGKLVEAADEDIAEAYIRKAVAWAKNILST